MKKSKDKTVRPQNAVKTMVPDMALERLEHAPWNPRTPADLAADNPEMQKLVASVKARGVIQPIAVWRIDGEEERRLVIAGNRRYAAAKYAGLATVPAVVFAGITEAEAREITRIENEVRLGVSPLKDAELISSMIERYGYSQSEVAAHFGVSEATVCRRMKLAYLSPEIREIAEANGSISADALERIALYPPETQAKCADTLLGVAKRCAKNGETVKWHSIAWDFDSKSKSLDDARFDVSPCAKCPKRTGAEADLWGDVKEGSLGRCLDGDCFDRRRLALLKELAKEEAAKSAHGKAFELYNGDECGVADWEASREAADGGAFREKRTNACNAAWWWEVAYRNEVKVLWGPTAEEWREICDRRDAEDAAKAEAEAAKGEVLRARQEERKALESAAEESFTGEIEDALEELSPCGTERCDYEAKAKELSGAVGKAALDKSARVALIELALRGVWALYADDDNPEEAVRLLNEIGALASALGMSGGAVKRYLDACRALDDFDAENGRV